MRAPIVLLRRNMLPTLRWDAVVREGRDLPQALSAQRHDAG